MFTIGTRVRKYRINKKGETRILLVIYQGKTNKEVSSGISVLPEDWDNNKGKVKSKDSDYQLKNSVLNKKIAEYESLLSSSIAADPNMTLAEILKPKKLASKNALLVDYLKEYIESHRASLKRNTILYHETTLMRISQYDAKIRIKDIDPKFLEGFENWLKKDFGNKQNTVWNRLKVIRKMCHLARKEGLISKNPFEFYKLKTEETKRDYLTIQEIKLLIQLGNLTPLQKLVRDTYIFCAFSGGLRFSDMVKLRADEITHIEDSYRLRLRMAKTERYIEFKLPEVAVKILQSYQGQNGDYCFPVLPENFNIEDLSLWISRKNALFNKTLKTIAKKAKVNKKLTFHTSRHTFATLSISSGIQTEVVKEMLGHKDLRTTQIYTKLVDAKKDEAIDKLNNLL